MTPKSQNFQILNLLVSSMMLAACSYEPIDGPTIGVSELARFDDGILESSGLALHEDQLWTLNDSSGGAEIFRLGADGQQQGSIQVANAQNVDWESMAHDAEYLYVADTGNNANTRDSFAIYRIAWAALADDSVVADVINFSYGDYESGDRLSHNFDAEALAVRGDELWLFSKNRGDGNSNLYRFPKVPGSYQPMPHQSLPLDSLVTAADINPDSGELAILSNRLINGRYSQYLWIAPTSSSGVDWARVRSARITPDDQWEAVVWDGSSGNLILSHERRQRSYSGLATAAVDSLFGIE